MVYACHWEKCMAWCTSKPMYPLSAPLSQVLFVFSMAQQSSALCTVKGYLSHIVAFFLLLDQPSLVRLWLVFSRDSNIIFSKTIHYVPKGPQSGLNISHACTLQATAQSFTLFTHHPNSFSDGQNIRQANCKHSLSPSLHDVLSRKLVQRNLCLLPSEGG